LEDGEVGVYKPHSGESNLLSDAAGGALYKREAAAYDVAKAMGWDDLVPETVVKRGPAHIGSVQKWVKGKIAGEAGGAVLQRIAEFEKEKLFAFDVIIANADRHGGNFMVTPASKIKAIDNGYAFLSNKVDCAISLRPYYPSYFNSVINLKVRKAIKKLLKNKTMLRARLKILGLEQSAIDLMFKRAENLSRLTKYSGDIIFDYEIGYK